MSSLSWLTMSPVNMEKLSFVGSKNWLIESNADRARSGGESQYRYPYLEAGTDALLTPVFKFVFIASGLQQRYLVQFASEPMSYRGSRCQSEMCNTSIVLPEGLGTVDAFGGLGLKY